MARKSGNVFRGNRMRRSTQWLEGEFGGTILGSTNAVAITKVMTTPELALRPFTIVRVRGMMHVRSDQTVGLESYGAMMGMCVVSDQSIAIGVSAVPTPDTDMASDAWFVHETVVGVFGFKSGVGVLELGQSHSYDSKAMRKVEEGFQTVQVMECPVNSGTVQDSYRMLIKLH